MKRAATVLATLVVMLGMAAPAFAGIVQNGNFEKGGTGWYRYKKGSGNWFTYHGKPSSCSGNMQDPPSRKYAAGTNMRDPGLHILYQDLRLPSGVGLDWSAYVFYNSDAAFVDGPTLSHRGVPNQQYRIDLVKRKASAKSLDPSDIYVNLFKTSPGDPLVLAPTLKSVDISALAGKRVRLRIAEVSNQDCLNAAIDKVKIQKVII